MSCPFCDYIAVTNGCFAQAEHIYVLYNHRPVLPGHVMVIPKRHVTHYHELTREEITEIGLATQALYKILFKAFKAQGFNLIIQDGENSGQSVPHLHLHVIPRRVGDMNNFRLYLTMLLKWFYRPILKTRDLQRISNQLKKVTAKADTILSPCWNVTWIKQGKEN